MSRDSLLLTLRHLASSVIHFPSIFRGWVFLRGTRLGKRVRLIRGGRLWVEGAARITVSDLAWFNCGPFPTALICAPGAEILIGVHTGFNYGACLRARHSIRIGEECMFGAMAMVRDHDGHRTAPVVIGDRVWLGHGVMVEPGVTIGDDAVISAGSVVMEDVPPRMIAMGNPARCMPLRALRRPAGARSEGGTARKSGDRLLRQVPDGWGSMPSAAGDKSGANSMRCF